MHTRQAPSLGYHFLYACLTFIALVGAMPAYTGDCESEYLPFQNEHPQLKLIESYPMLFASARWTASGPMRQYFNQQKELLKYLQTIDSNPDADKQLAFATVGDVMRLPNMNKNHVNENLISHLSKFDVVVGNLETQISYEHEVEPDGILSPTFFLMNSAPTLVTDFEREDGTNIFDALSTANNHSYDKGDKGLRNTLDYLKSQDIQQSGARVNENDKSYTVIEKKGVKIGYYALTTFINKSNFLDVAKTHVNLLEGIEPEAFEFWQSDCDIDLSALKSVMKQMEDEGVDIKMVSVHWGYEMHAYPEYLQMQLARKMVRLGADVILGSHPHIAQPSEVCFVDGYEQQLPASLAQEQETSGCVLFTNQTRARKALIIYSLGNFSTWMSGFWPQSGVIGEFEISKSKNAVTDWNAPRFTYVFNELQHLNNGRRQLWLLDDYISRVCGEHGCPGYDDSMFIYLQKHVTEPALNYWEELRVIGLGYLDYASKVLFGFNTLVGT